MAERLNLKNVVKHLANDTLSDLCLICLVPLEDKTFESIFTLVCKEEREYCVADALETVCQFQFEGTENHNICVDCFKSASASYKFYLQAMRSMEIITFYTQELLDNIKNVEVTNEDTEKLLCIPLSDYTPETCLFDFSLDGIGRKTEDNINETTECKDDLESKNVVQKEDNLIVVVENENTSYFNLDSNGSLAPMKSDNEAEDEEDVFMIVNEKKVRKKRDPMVSMTCTQCPIKYRFVSKLKDHMKSVHNIDMYYCKICKIMTENKEEYEEHLNTHTGKHQCAICNVVYKKRESLELHMKVHDVCKEENILEKCENANICELCGAILEDEGSLQDHIASKHVKKYTCYYCGRMYRGEASFEGHIQKHEEYWKKKTGKKTEKAISQSSEKENTRDRSKRSVCQTCGKDFVDERSLLWHQRLHDDDRPFTCEVCGRGFVSKNRRNQHSVCAHTPPARRCPLCPALFHLRSMVNTHVKKVHLKAHKRRNRTTKHRHVYWRTEPVPIQELSVDVQHDVLELQTSRADEMVIEPAAPPSPKLFM